MRILLVIDLQRQFKDNGGKYEKCLAYIEKHRNEYDRVVATLFRQDRSVNGNYSKLRYTGCMDADVKDIEFPADQVIIKHGYGLPGSIFSRKDKITVIGCESDACVLATCFGLWDDGLDFEVLQDYIFTNGGYKDIWKIYERNFGKRRRRLRR